MTGPPCSADLWGSDHGKSMRYHLPMCRVDEVGVALRVVLIPPTRPAVGSRRVPLARRDRSELSWTAFDAAASSVPPSCGSDRSVERNAGRGAGLRSAGRGKIASPGRHRGTRTHDSTRNPRPVHRHQRRARRADLHRSPGDEALLREFRAHRRRAEGPLRDRGPPRGRARHAPGCGHALPRSRGVSPGAPRYDGRRSP